MFRFKFLILVYLFLFLNSLDASDKRKVVYIASDINIPFWKIMYNGMKDKADKLNYDIKVYNANNTRKLELQNIVKAIASKVDGLIFSPINSSTAVTVLKIAKDANVPVVISDIGTTKGEYVSYITSNNEVGSYKVGKMLAKKMNSLGIDKTGVVGIISISQKRINGKKRTAGFMKAMKEAGIKTTELRQQITFSYEETYNFTKELIRSNPNLKALWLQASNQYQAALDAIKNEKKEGKILLMCFDAEPIFLDLIPKGVIVGTGMQQPYLMGQKAIIALDDYLHGKKVQKEEILPILAISKENIEEKLPIIRKNVLGIKKD